MNIKLNIKKLSEAIEGLPYLKDITFGLYSSEEEANKFANCALFSFKKDLHNFLKKEKKFSISLDEIINLNKFHEIKELLDAQILICAYPEVGPIINMYHANIRFRYDLSIKDFIEEYNPLKRLKQGKIKVIDEKDVNITQGGAGALFGGGYTKWRHHQRKALED